MNGMIWGNFLLKLEGGGMTKYSWDGRVRNKHYTRKVWLERKESLPGTQWHTKLEFKVRNVYFHHSTFNWNF